MTTLVNSAQIECDIHVDCVVVGAGACGLIAALVLSEAGLETVVLERDVAASGSTSMSSGFIPAAGTNAQQRQGINDSSAQFAADIQRKAHNEADPTVVKAVTETSGKVLNWLEANHGFQWLLLDDFLYPGHTAHRMHAVPEKTGAALHDQLLIGAKSAGVDVVTRARVDALIVNGCTDPQRRSADAKFVSGVRVARTDGAYEHIGAQAVILACNGYGGNPALMERFIPEMANALYHGHAGNTGDAVVWGEQLGVPLEHTAAYQGHGSVAVGHNILITWALMMEGGVQVNLEGLRFSNEHAGYSEQAVNVIRQPKAIVWSLYDQRLHEMGLTFPDYQQASKAGAIVIANDVAALATATGLPIDNLRSTLTHMHELSAQNGTDEFGRQFSSSATLQPPYVAIKVGPAVFHTQGGLTIDQSARVIGDDGKPMAGLLAAGGAACGVSGSSVTGYLSGNGLLTAVALGYIAAQTVVKELQINEKI